jgi:hypothetical protein
MDKRAKIVDNKKSLEQLIVNKAGTEYCEAVPAYRVTKKDKKHKLSHFLRIGLVQA